MDIGDIFTPDGLAKDTEADRRIFTAARATLKLPRARRCTSSRVPNIEHRHDGSGLSDGATARNLTSRKLRSTATSRPRTRSSAANWRFHPATCWTWCASRSASSAWKACNILTRWTCGPNPSIRRSPGEKNLIVNVEEKSTGNFTVGAGFSSVDSLVGYAEVSQGNFDLFHPPYFTGGGQKIRLRVQLGTQRQDYELSFIEPWFLNRKLSLGVDLYRHQLDFESPNNIFDETRTGAKISLTRALGSDFLIGSVSYTVEDVGISLNSGWHDLLTLFPGQSSAFAECAASHSRPKPATIFISAFGGSLAYDTRNSTQLPNHGQRSELSGEVSTGDTTYYKVELTTSWFFPGFFKGHVIRSGRARRRGRQSRRRRRAILRPLLSWRHVFVARLQIPQHCAARAFRSHRTLCADRAHRRRHLLVWLGGIQRSHL